MDILIAKYLEVSSDLKIQDIIKFYPDIPKDQLIDRVVKIKEYRKQLKRLIKEPVIKQKTEEWYNLRKDMITASDFAQALGMGKFGSKRELIEKKCEDSQTFTSNPFFEWGNFFEPIASKVYSDMFHVKVYEFGLLSHPTYSFFGASPDGISNLGIMVEIKCPMKRKIKGDIPEQYYYQIQGQLDVCKLEECDYFECEFTRYTDYDTYKDKYQNGSYTGYVIEEEEKLYKYSNVFNSLVPKQNEVNKIYYWILEKYNIQRVKRDIVFLEDKLEQLEEVWNNILFYRENRDAYVKDIKKSMFLDTESYLEKDTCYIRNIS